MAKKFKISKFKIYLSSGKTEFKTGQIKNIRNFTVKVLESGKLIFTKIIYTLVKNTSFLIKKKLVCQL